MAMTWEQETERYKRLHHQRQEEVTFYDSRAWLELRYRVLTKQGGCCECCGNRGSFHNPLQVDHIKPRSKFPELALDIKNLQVLCRDCNIGKGWRDETDWRCR